MLPDYDTANFEVAKLTSAPSTSEIARIGRTLCGLGVPLVDDGQTPP